MSDLDLQQGEMYRVTKPGASLSVEEPTGPSAWSVSSHELSVGDEITYIGKAAGLGHDNIPQDAFETDDGTSGKFRPDSWGSADTSFLEPADDTA